MNIQIDNVGKRYKGDVWGLRRFSLKLGPGVLGLLGPNGAGKTTLMNILATVTRPTEGLITWNDVDIARSPMLLRSILGYLPQNFGIYPHLSTLEFLNYLAALKGISASESRRRIDRLLQLVNLADSCRRPLGELSGGVKQRVGIAQALLNDPQILLDEPTVGLDPEERVRFRNLLAELSGERIVILSTHIVSDVEATATEIVLINKGKMLKHALPEELLQSVEGKVWECVISSQELATFRQQHLVSSTIRRSGGIQARVVSDERPANDSTSISPMLEDAYLYHISNANAQVCLTEDDGK